MYGKYLALARPHCDQAVLSVRRTLADLSIVNSNPECTMSLSEAPWRWQYKQLEWILWENLNCLRIRNNSNYIVYLYARYFWNKKW